MSIVNLPEPDGSAEEAERQEIERRREMMELLSQETRYAIIVAILGHPAHLPSSSELEYIVQDKSDTTIRNHLETLIEEDVVNPYVEEENKSTREFPSKFFGFTENGVQYLDEFGYLNALPMFMALYEKTFKPPQIERHESAPRPDLPDSVQALLSQANVNDCDDPVSETPQEG